MSITETKARLRLRDLRGLSLQEKRIAIKLFLRSCQIGHNAVRLTNGTVEECYIEAVHQETITIAPAVGIGTPSFATEQELIDYLKDMEEDVPIQKIVEVW